MLAMDRPRILVVDDDSAVRNLLGGYFEDQGYRVLYAGTAARALGMVEGYQPHVVLLDLNMPGAVHGGAVVKAISEVAAVIIITGEVDLDIARRTLLDGAMDFVSKPFNFARRQMIVDAALAFGRRETA